MSQEHEMIKNFGDMVEANEKLTRPWKILCAWLLAALVATNLIWGFVHWKQLQYAYMTPEEFSQSQQFEEQAQEQHYSINIKMTDGAGFPSYRRARLDWLPDEPESDYVNRKEFLKEIEELKGLIINGKQSVRSPGESVGE